MCIVKRRRQQKIAVLLSRLPKVITVTSFSCFLLKTSHAYTNVITHIPVPKNTNRSISCIALYPVFLF